MYRDITSHATNVCSKALKRISLALALAGVSTVSVADTWPKLINGSIDQCKEALRIADAAFHSNAGQLHTLPKLPSDLNSMLVLGARDSDISGGDALHADSTQFDKRPNMRQDSQQLIYWQKVARQGSRLVMVETPQGWQGDTYTLFLIKEEVDWGSFLTRIKTEDQPQEFRLIASRRWWPPFIFQSKGLPRPAWIIDIEQPYRFLSDWQVHIAEPDRTGPACTIQFRRDVRYAVNFLPKPVQKLENLLDRTMGRGENDGTLQSTARLRTTVENMWANAALRPWASLGLPYNNRTEVDDELKAWAKKGPSYREVYQAIQRQYPLAQKSLAAYYRSKFQRSPKEAEALAVYVLDIAFRTHYTFHSEHAGENNETQAPHPWRAR